MRLMHPWRAGAGGAFPRKGPWLLGGFSALYFLATCLLALRKPLWYDELFTVHLCRLPNLSALWAALAAGTDLNPPLGYLATRAAQALVGEGPLGVRLPAILGYWVMCLCLYRFVSRSCSPLYGWLALCLPLATVVFPFAYEARPYGLLLGFAGLSLVCWQEAAAGGRRRPALAGLALSLGAAVLTHYYAVLLFIPLAAGEVTRSLSRKGCDWPLWLALGAAALPLVFLLPLVAQARSFAGAFWAKPSWDDLKPTYYYLFPYGKSALIVSLLLLLLYPERPPAGALPPHRDPPAHELAVGLGYVTIPLLAMLLGQALTGVFVIRYVMPAVLGFGIVVAFLVYRRTAGSRVFGGALTAVFLGFFLLGLVREWKLQGERRAEIRQTCEYLRRHGETDLPLVVADPADYLEAAYHAPAPVAAHLLYVTDREAPIRYGFADTEERALGALRGWAGLNVVDYRSFLAGHRHFLVFGAVRWLKPALEADGAGFQLLDGEKGHALFAVRLPE
jgi:hypothetical protein